MNAALYTEGAGDPELPIFLRKNSVLFYDLRYPNLEHTMLHIANSVAEVVLPILYVLITYMYAVTFFGHDAISERWKSRGLLLTVVIHFIYVGLHTAEYSRCMVTTPFEIMSLIAFTLVLTYAIIEFRTGEKGTGLFILALATMFEITSTIVMKLSDPNVANPVLSNMGIGLHVTLAIFGYAGFALSAMYSVMYLMMYRELKRGSTGSAYRNLPSLEGLERMTVVPAIVGFAFLTISIVLGLLWLPKLYMDFSWLDPKLLSTGVVWLLYLALLLARYVLRIEGKRIVLMSLCGFAGIILSLTIVNVFLSDFHRFL
jgi:HemX protein